MRVFAAIPIEGELRECVTGLIRELSRRFPNCRWVRPDNLHVTLRFVGEIADDSLDEVIEFVRRCVFGALPEPIALQGNGMFWNRDRVAIWLGVQGGDWMRQIAGNLSGSVAGLPTEDRSFKAHLTLGRMRVRKKQQGEVESVMAAFEGMAEPEVRQSEVRCALYQSELSGRGARYRELWSGELGGLEGRADPPRPVAAKWNGDGSDRAAMLED